jgi:hypothetical protein
MTERFPVKDELVRTEAGLLVPAPKQDLEEEQRKMQEAWAASPLLGRFEPGELLPWKRCTFRVSVIAPKGIILELVRGPKVKKHERS